MTETLQQPLQTVDGQITLPGVYDIPADVYHADPIPGGSLSASGVNKLLAPSCPARFRYDADHPAAPRKVFELGHAAHKEVLGSGPELVLIDAEEWRTNVVKAEVAAAREAGKVPLKPSEWDMVKAMAAALRRNEDAAALLDPASGVAEQSLFWQHEGIGIWRRARVDWLRVGQHGRMIVPDYKSCVSAAPDDLSKVIYDRGYHRAGRWYLDGVQALGLAADPVFCLIFQEKTPPYLVTVVEPDRDALRIGGIDNLAAIEIYKTCMETGVWPGYADGPIQVALPRWVERQYEDGRHW